jgi:hypothetical protein
MLPAGVYAGDFQGAGGHMWSTVRMDRNYPRACGLLHRQCALGCGTASRRRQSEYCRAHGPIHIHTWAVLAVENGSIREWLVVDCRTSIPEDTCGYNFFLGWFLRRNLLTWADDDPHLWRAIFTNDFKDLEIRNNLGQSIREPISLHGPLIR